MSAAWHTWRYVRNPLRFYVRHAARHGEAFRIPTVLGPVVVLASARHVRTLFSLPPDSFERWSIDAVAPLFGRDSLLLTSGAAHLALRRTIAPTLCPDAEGRIAASIRDVVLDHVEGWPAGVAFDVQERLVALAIDVIVRLVIGPDGDARSSALREAVLRTIGSMGPAMMLSRMVDRRFERIGPYRRFLEARDALDRLLYEEIDRKSKNAGADGSILGAMARLRNAAGDPAFGRSALRDQAMTLIFAGHETSAIALSWAIHWLVHHPATMDRLFEDIDAGRDVQARANDMPLDGDTGAAVVPERGEADAPRPGSLLYLDAVCNEALRLHPTVPEVVRKLRVPMRFGDLTVPAGMPVAASITAIHHDPRLYPWPVRFVPERFLERRFGAHEFLPFGGGVHRCAGEALARLEMKTILRTLIGSHAFSAAGDASLQPTLRSITMGPDGPVMVRMERRREVRR